MKRTGLLLLVVILALFLGACSKGPSDEECLAAWMSMDWETLVFQSAKGETSMEGAFENLEDNINKLVSTVLNEEHSPDSIGFTLKVCIENGWDWRHALDVLIDEFRILTQ